MRKLFSLALLLLALNVEAAANKLVSTLPTTNVIWLTNYVMVVLQAGLSNQTFLVPWTNIAQQISAAQVWTNANSTNLPVSGSSVLIPMLTTIGSSNDSANAVLRLIIGEATNAISAVVCTDSRFTFLSKSTTSDDGQDIFDTGIGFKSAIFASGGLVFRGHAADPSNIVFQAGSLTFQGNYWSTNFGGYSAAAQFSATEQITDGTHFKLNFQANTDDDGDLGSASLDQSGVWTANGIASLSTLATNAVTATGVTNTSSVNRQVRVTATAVSFTVNDASGAVLDTTPTLTATIVYTLQPGWSIRAASGLAGTMLPW